MIVITELVIGVSVKGIHAFDMITNLTTTLVLPVRDHTHLLIQAGDGRAALWISFHAIVLSQVIIGKLFGKHMMNIPLLLLPLANHGRVVQTIQEKMSFRMLAA